VTSWRLIVDIIGGKLSLELSLVIDVERLVLICNHLFCELTNYDILFGVLPQLQVSRSVVLAQQIYNVLVVYFKVAYRNLSHRIGLADISKNLFDCQRNHAQTIISSFHCICLSWGCLAISQDACWFND